MLARKIETALKSWKEQHSRKPLVIKGCRQCGKTFSVQKFVRENYSNAVYLNFMLNPIYSTAFEDSLEVDTIIMNLTSLIPDAAFVPGETCLILDEIQDCPEARTALKFFCLDGRFDVICTGSLLGVKGYGNKKRVRTSSIPVGYETLMDMRPLDFEEFLWANGIPEAVIARLARCIEDENPVPGAIHQRMRQLLLQYAVVGGMPEAVNTFVASHDMGAVLRVQRAILSEYEDDMVKYAEEADKARIRECFESIPEQLSKENKKFQYSVIRKSSTAAMYAGSLQWIEDAGIIRRCCNLSIPQLPLDGHAEKDVFKVYMADTGLFVAMLEDGTQYDILRGNLLGYKGALFENIMADFLGKMGRKLYYFHKDSGLEVDFVMRYKGECTLVEVKATTGNAKSVKTILKHPEKYHVSHAIKLGDYNVGRAGQVLTLPFYTGFLLNAI